jgi:hypothetical protein
MPISNRIEFPITKSHFEELGSEISMYKNKEYFDGFLVLLDLKNNLCGDFSQEKWYFGRSVHAC